MSPSRRDFFKLMTGGAMSLAGVSTVVAAEPDISEWEELAAVRAALIDVRNRHGGWPSDDPLALQLHMAVAGVGWSMMEQCPHGRDTWRIEEDEYHPEDSWVSCCDACGVRMHETSWRLNQQTDTNT